jgi:hypothetical protein
LLSLAAIVFRFSSPVPRASRRIIAPIAATFDLLAARSSLLNSRVV